MSLGLTYRLPKGAEITPAEYDATLTALEAACFPTDVLVVRSLADLPAPVAGEITLPGGVVLLLGEIDLGANALRLSTNTLLRGLGWSSIMSTTAGGVVRATNLGAAVVMREFNIIALGGPCLNLVGGIEHQLNLFFLGLIGAAPGTSVGTITGFDVQAMKDCFISAPDGVHLHGTTNKIFFSQCPFYSITGGAAAITFSSDLVARRVDMVTNFFKHPATGIPIRAEVGYDVGYGQVTGSMMDGPTQMLDGLANTDDNWWFYRNDLILNSRICAQSYLTEPATTPITTIGAYVPVTGPFTVTPLTQRMAHSGTNQLIHTGGDPALITFVATFSVDPANNNTLAFRATKNGVTLPYSQTTIQQGAGSGASPRTGTVTALIESNFGDEIGLAVANLEAVSGVPWIDCTFTVNA